VSLPDYQSSRVKIASSKAYLLQAAVASSEPGNNFYALHKSRTDENQYIVLEQYADQAALDAHGASAHFKSIGAKMGPCLAGRPQVEYLDAL
jgi:quinol monooxygenase YgiN